MTFAIITPPVDTPAPPPETPTIDIPVKILNADEWASIGTKHIQAAFPTKIYDNGAYPYRKITCYPVPTQAQVMKLWLWEPLINFNDLDAEIDLPKGYERALRFNLAIEIAAEFGKTIPDQIKNIAKQSKANIKRLNSVPQVTVGDTSIAGTGKGYFNWLIGDSIPN